jgi:CRP-like cAMP-binding protein
MTQPVLPLSRFSAFADLTEREQATLQGLAEDCVTCPRETVIIAEGEALPRLFLLHSGWAATSIGLLSGERQLIKIHMPGDMMGVSSLSMESVAETIVALTPVTVSHLAPTALSRIFSEMPRLAMLFYLAAQEERIILMDRMTAIGRRTARQRVAALLAHLIDRLRLLDPDHPLSITVPLTQEQIGDLLGLTAVHVNRVLRILEDDGLIRRVRKHIDLLDPEGLRDIAALPRRVPVRNPSWLPPAL